MRCGDFVNQTYMRKDDAVVPVMVIEEKIYMIRGQKVIVDRDLARMYGVSTMALNQAVKRNSERFPTDFMFQMSKDEMTIWISQIVISKSDRMGLRRRPLVFTELGVAMPSSVLRSPRAIAVNIFLSKI